MQLLLSKTLTNLEELFYDLSVCLFNFDWCWVWFWGECHLYFVCVPYTLGVVSAGEKQFNQKDLDSQKSAQNTVFKCQMQWEKMNFI